MLPALGELGADVVYQIRMPMTAIPEVGYRSLAAAVTRHSRLVPGRRHQAGHGSRPAPAPSASVPVMPPGWLDFEVECGTQVYDRTLHAVYRHGTGYLPIQTRHSHPDRRTGRF